MAGQKPFVITVVGAESSGKTKLSSHLAGCLGCLWIPEYAREYLGALNRPYNETDIEIIADRQIEVINRIVKDPLKRTYSNDSSSQFFTHPPDIFKFSQGFQELFSIITKQIDARGLNSAVIIDSGILTLRLWSRIKFNTVVPAVENELRKDITDLYLLCRTRREWESDPLREAPLLAERAWIYNQYLMELSRSEVPVIIVPEIQKINPSPGL